MEIELSSGELFFVHVHRNFHFLIEMGYVGNEFMLNTRGTQWVSFYSQTKKIKIIILELNDGTIDFRVKKDAFLSSEISIYQDWNKSYKIQTIKRMAEIIKETPRIWELIY